MSDTLVAQGFNYSALSAEVAGTARAVADRIRDQLSRQKTSVIETGYDLLEIKKHLKHGQFLEWLNAEFGMTDRTAENYMLTATSFGDKSEIISNLPLAEVYLLAAPSTPSSVRDAVVSRLEAGERIEPVEVRALVRDAKEDDRRVKAEAKMSSQQRKKKAQRQAEEEQRQERSRIRHEAAERTTAELVKFIAERFGPALPDVISQIGVAKSKGAYLHNVIFMLLERDAKLGDAE